jgi:hypothetical protein
LIELISYIENRSKDDSYIEFLEKKIECNINQNNIDESDLDDNLENLSERHEYNKKKYK